MGINMLNPVQQLVYQFKKNILWIKIKFKKRIHLFDSLRPGEANVSMS